MAITDLITVEVNDIVVDDTMNVSRFAPRGIKGLVKSIEKQGLLVPVTVTPIDGAGTNGGVRYRLVTGSRRLRAVMELGLQEIQALVDTPTPGEDSESPERQAYERDANVIENFQRTPMSPMDYAKAIVELARPIVDADGGILVEGRYQKDIAAMLDRTQSWVSKTANLMKLPVVAQDAVDAGKLPWGIAVTWASMPDAQIVKAVNEQLPGILLAASGDRKEKSKKTSEARAQAADAKGTKREPSRTSRQIVTAMEALNGGYTYEDEEIGERVKTIASSVVKYIQGKIGETALYNAIERAVVGGD